MQISEQHPPIQKSEEAVAPEDKDRAAFRAAFLALEIGKAITISDSTKKSLIHSVRNRTRFILAEKGAAQMTLRFLAISATEVQIERIA